MNGWNPEIPTGNRIDEPPRHVEINVKVGNAALNGVMFVALSASIYGGVKAGAIDAAIGMFRTSSEVTETTVEVSQAPKVVKPLVKDVGEEAGEQGQRIQGVAAGAGRGAVGARTEEEINKDVTSKDIERIFAREKTVERFLESYIRRRDRSEDLTKAKDYDIAFDPAKLNSAMRLDMELLDDFIREQDITPDGISEKLVGVGQSRQASEILEDFFKSHITSQPISPERAEEIRSWWEQETGLEWKTGK